MSSCPGRSGNADMYGLGIRLSFYIQWFSTMLSAHVVPLETHPLRLSLLFFISATFLAILIQVSWRRTITALDVYVTLLLTYGSYYYYVPVYLWRILTLCNPFWDPTRWPKVPVTTGYRRVNLVMLLAVTGFQIWFWGVGVRELPSVSELEGGDGGGQECREYGFFFTKVPFQSGLFIAVNIFFAVMLLFCCFVSMAMDVGVVPIPRWMRRQEKSFDRELDRYEDAGQDYPWVSELQFFQTVTNALVATAVIVATELTIQWNNLTDVNDVSTAGQTIPIIIAVGLVAHMLWIWMNPDHDKNIHRALKPRKYKRTIRPNKGFEPPERLAEREPAVRPIPGFHVPLSVPAVEVEVPRPARHRHRDNRFTASF